MSTGQTDSMSTGQADSDSVTQTVPIASSSIGSNNRSLDGDSNLLADLPRDGLGDWGADITGHGVTLLNRDLDWHLDGNGVALLHLPGVTDRVHLSPGDGFAVGGGTGAANCPGNLPGHGYTVRSGDGDALRNLHTVGDGHTNRNRGAPGH